jgi:alkylation response protein AidB-like acyl-CoA dehydrogenase
MSIALKRASLRAISGARRFAILNKSFSDDRYEEKGNAMNFGFSEEQDELRKMVRRFLDDKSPETAVREQMATADGYDKSVWKQMAEELGLQALGIPEEFGGQGFGPVEQYVVFEEMGAALLCAPYFSTVALAANALLESGDDKAKAEYLPGIAAGETIATLALTDDAGSWVVADTSTTASGSGDSYTINGVKNYVIDGSTASLILVSAKTAKGLSLFAVAGDAAGLTSTALPTMDQTRKQSRLEFVNTPARLIGTDGGAEAGLKVALQKAAALLAAEQVGGSQRVLDNAVAYAKERVQFGRPIGSFQAIKHKAADMLLEVESAKSAAYYAAYCSQENNDDLAVAASLAKSYCSEAYFHCAGENIQIHGGIGFTWEHHAHLYFKRAKSSELLLGDPAYHREILAQLLGI